MNKPQVIVIAGGTGLIGSKLAIHLASEGHTVRVLSRKPDKFIHKNIISAYFWDIKNKRVDIDAFEQATVLINLCGENIASERWTETRKKQLKLSRTEPVKFLYSCLQKSKHKLEHYIGASATGYYGAVTSDNIFTEYDPPAHDFLGKLCIAWETAHNRMQKIAPTVSITRISPVLSTSGGMLPKLANPVKYGLAASIGSGKQFVPWIHIEDFCRMTNHIIDHKREGIYNAVAPEQVNYNNFIKKLTKQLNRPRLFPNIPSIALKLGLGEMATMLLTGSPISCKKIESENFQFKYKTLTEALANLYSKK